MGCIDEAANVFELIDEKDIVAWSAMVAGYAQREDTEGAVKIYLWLATEGVKPNEFTFCSIVNAIFFYAIIFYTFTRSGPRAIF